VGPVDHGASIDELLDRAIAAINRGDRVSAATVTGRPKLGTHLSRRCVP
jgi:hypothetical protein